MSTRLATNFSLEELCRTLAAGTSRSLPRVARVPRVQRVEDVLRWLWPHLTADCPDASASVLALLRHALRRARLAADRRWVYLACACAQRLLDQAAWLPAASRRC